MAPPATERWCWALIKLHHQEWSSKLQKTMLEMFPLRSADAASGKIKAMLSTLADPFTRVHMQVNNKEMSIAVLRAFISKRKQEHEAMLSKRARSSERTLELEAMFREERAVLEAEVVSTSLCGWAGLWYKRVKPWRRAENFRSIF